MNNHPEIVSQLWNYIEGNSSKEENVQLFKQVESLDNEALTSILDSLWNEPEHSKTVLSPEKAEAIIREILRKVPAKPSKRPVVSQKWFLLAAASVLLLFIVGEYLNNVIRDHQNIANSQQIANDLPPGTTKAVLTLADGSTIVLNNAVNGNLAKQGSTKILKLDKQLVYKNAGNETKVLYNTISTPRGGMYQLVLADGSIVYLNSSSSIRFPTSFPGKERRVDITGEAYFEIEKNSSMPFIVNVAGKGEVTVIGTHFNVNAYPEEASINTTLLEGSVKVSVINSTNSCVIKPGEQAELNTNGQISINSNPDIAVITGWKNGLFIFKSQNIGSIMRQISRWYDIDVLYSGELSKETFSGIVSRNSNLLDVLKILQVGGVKFKIEGKQLEISN